MVYTATAGASGVAGAVQRAGVARGAGASVIWEGSRSSTTNAGKTTGTAGPPSRSDGGGSSVTICPGLHF